MKAASFPHSHSPYGERYAQINAQDGLWKCRPVDRLGTTLNRVAHNLPTGLGKLAQHIIQNPAQ